MRKTFGLTGLLLAVCLMGLSVFGGYASEEESKTEWMAVFMNGAKSGHARMDRKMKEGIVTTTVDMVMEIKRGVVNMKVATISESRETIKGKPLGFKQEMKAAVMTQKTSGVIKAGKLHVTSEAGGMKQEKVLDWPADALMPEGLRLLGLKKGLKKGTTYTAKAFDSSSEKIMDTTVTVGGTKNVDLMGRVVRLTDVTVVVSMGGTEITTHVYVNEKNEALKSSLTMMGMPFEMIACTKQFALSANEPGDFFNKTVVKAPQPLSIKDRSKSITFTLIPVDKESKLNFINSDEQKAVVAKTSGVITLDVNVRTPKAGVPFPYKGKDKDALSALKPSTFIQCDAKEIKALADKAVGDAKDAADAVKRIETFTRDYITSKNLAVGYASALEVAQSKEGDCTEHAVLATALCRAKGIPARVASGLAYVSEFIGHQDIFGPHAWFQVYIGDKWISFDAALNGFDAGHILLGHGDGQPDNFFDLVNILGNVKMTKAVVGK